MGSKRIILRGIPTCLLKWMLKNDAPGIMEHLSEILEEFHWRVKERKKKEKRSQRKYEKVFLFCLIRLKVSERMSQNVAVSEMAEESPPESLRDSERIPWDNIPIFTLLYGSIKKKYLCKRERKREREREREREKERERERKRERKDFWPTMAPNVAKLHRIIPQLI